MNNPQRYLRLWTAGLALLFLCAATTLADPITLQANSSGAFSAGSSGVTVGAGGSSITATAGGTTASITFSSVSPQINVAINPGEVTNVTLGRFTVASNSGLDLNSGPNFSGATFQLRVTFTLPGDVTSQIFSGNITGRIVQTASGAVIEWSSPTVLTFNSATAGIITLRIESLTTINPPGSGGSNPPSEIRARIELGAAPVVIPEPATLLLLGSGLAGLAAGYRKKRSRVKNGE
jgi:hypothetical protein